MANIEQQIKKGKDLLKTFRQLDKKILDWGLLQDGDNRAILIDDIKHFDKRSEKYIDSLQDEVDGDNILAESREHEYVNDHEVGNLALSEFYSYGIAIKQIVEELEIHRKGSQKIQLKYDGKFHYIAEDKILYRNNNKLRIRSQNFKRESILEVVFECAPEWVSAIDIGDRQEEKSGYADDIGGNPYKWIRPACNYLNKKVRYKFEIEFDLLEKNNNQVRLNPKAI